MTRRMLVLSLYLLGSFCFAAGTILSMTEPR